jgi:hypothetical protein
LAGSEYSGMVLEEGAEEEKHYSSGGLAAVKYSCPRAEVEEEYELVVVAEWAVKVVKIV